VNEILIDKDENKVEHVLRSNKDKVELHVFLLVLVVLIIIMCVFSF